MNDYLTPGSTWKCKRDTVIDRKTIPKGTQIEISALSITVRECLVQFYLDSYVRITDSKNFRKHFIKTKEAINND